MSSSTSPRVVSRIPASSVRAIGHRDEPPADRRQRARDRPDGVAVRAATSMRDSMPVAAMVTAR